MQHFYVQLAIDVPLYQLFEYRWEKNDHLGIPEIGALVEVEFGNKNTTGIVLEVSKVSVLKESKGLKIKEVISRAPCGKLQPQELELYQFAAKYYLRPIGEVIFSSIPADWKKPKNWPRIQKQILKKEQNPVISEEPLVQIRLNSSQNRCLKTLENITSRKQYEIALLKGITGSGKTAVYLEWLRRVTEDKSKQCLILVPEINLTPQLEQTIRKYCGKRDLVILHSHLTPAERNYSWWKIQQGYGQIIIGTRLSIFTPVKHLAAIVVDEEHDNSYKQQDGMRYSARDVAIWRASNLKIPVLLCSATPSIETWLKHQEEKIHFLELNQRANLGATIPKIELVNLKQEKLLKQLTPEGVSQKVIEQIRQTAQRKKQSLIFINRRGYAPILSCEACAWKSECQKCSSWMVFHKQVGASQKSMLQCHHCGLAQWPPKHCPQCANQDLQTFGVGTQQVEELVETIFSDLNVLRIDSDSTKKKGEMEALLSKVHNQEVDIIVGTQMLSKGHDFSNVETVVVLDIDKSLYSQDFRATEKMFAQLVQVAGRSGRGENLENAKILIQTEFTEHEIFRALATENYEGFYASLLNERRIAKLPPYTHQALVLIESKIQAQNISILNDIQQFLLQQQHRFKGCLVYDPVARGLQRLAGMERAQLLIESANRSSLQGFLELALDYCEAIKKKSRSIRLLIERDPITF